MEGKKRFFSWLRNEERASATIIEYTLILPLVMAIIFAMVITGYIMHQKAVMESATTRGAIYITKTIADPNYEELTDIDPAKDANEITGITIKNDIIVNKPYRYLFRLSGNIPSGESYVAELIKRNQIFVTSTPTVTVEEESGIFRKVIVSATQEYDVPKLLPGLELPPIVTIYSQSVVYVNEPAEFIRNADYAIDIVFEVADKISGKISDKLKTVISKISFFKDMDKDKEKVN